MKLKLKKLENSNAIFTYECNCALQTNPNSKRKRSNAKFELPARAFNYPRDTIYDHPQPLHINE